MIGAKRVDVIVARANRGDPGPGGREWPHWERTGKLTVPVVPDVTLLDGKSPKSGLSPSKAEELRHNYAGYRANGSGPAPQIGGGGIPVPWRLGPSGPPKHSLVNTNRPSSAFSAPLNAPAKGVQK